MRFEDRETETHTVVDVFERLDCEGERPPGADEAAGERPPGGSLERLRTVAKRLAAGSIPVLVLGETGVGKDVLSSMIHRSSPRAARPYVCINCGALPGALVESALFGHERGAFTDATATREGLLESARGGTAFLDEVAEIPLAAQAALLRVLDHGEVLRIGATRPRPIDVRFIAATNRDLEREVERGCFRQDLYFRLAAATIVVPPLRERLAEIAPLAQTFVRRTCRDLARARVPRILPDALALLERHVWPGNVRELRNVMERAVLLAGEGDIGPAQLPLERIPPLHLGARVAEAITRDPEVGHLLAVLGACNWNQTRAAVELGLSRRTLVARLSEHGLTRKRAR
jgi:two-component system response regulator AtoC